MHVAGYFEIRMQGLSVTQELNTSYDVKLIKLCMR